VVDRAYTPHAPFAQRRALGFQLGIGQNDSASGNRTARIKQWKSLLSSPEALLAMVRVDSSGMRVARLRGRLRAGRWAWMVGLTMAGRRGWSRRRTRLLRARRRGREGFDPGWAVCGVGLAPSPCQEGCDAGADAKAGAARGSPAPDLRRGNHCRAGVLLGGAGRFDGAAAGLDHGRTGAKAATFRSR